MKKFKQIILFLSIFFCILTIISAKKKKFVLQEMTKKIKIAMIIAKDGFRD